MTPWPTTRTDSPATGAASWQMASAVSMLARNTASSKGTSAGIAAVSQAAT